MRVSSAEFIKNYGSLTDKALGEPVTITRNGRDRLVLMSAQEYARLKKRDRRVVATGELSEAEVDAIAQSAMPGGHEHLDAELSDWKP
jgi:PHD/YefM family antitoxin component YafN of YafNO toxin-antitoxin module